MSLDELAKALSDTSRIGLSPGLVGKLGLPAPDAVRGRLLAETDDDHGHLQVLFLGCFVVDDTDFWGDGEIYWWSVPALLDEEGKAIKSALHALPSGMPPHKCGDMEWMTNLSLARPALWAVIPPGGEVATCVVRVGIYDDDRDPADLPGAVTAGLESLAAVSDARLSGAEQIITPVRTAIYEHLQAQDDDILIDQDLILRRGEVSRFNVGMIGSIIHAKARAYYLVRDTERTKQFGPVTMQKGQSELISFDEPIRQGGRLALFARGHDVACPSFGDLSVDHPFTNKVITARQEETLERGFSVISQGPAKVVAYYTPPYGPIDT